jgi:hypothetical protein
MRAVNAAAQGLRETRGGLAERFMIWIEARNRASNAVEGLGLWTGEDTEETTALDLWTNATVTRMYQGAGGLLAVTGLQHTAGLEVRPVHVTLSALDATVTLAVRDFDVRGARVQIWRRTLSAETGLPVGAPEPAFMGFVNRAPIPRPAAGGLATIELECVSAVRLLTVPNGRKKSDAAQRLRDPDDAFRQYKGDPEAGDAVLGHQRQAR